MKIDELLISDTVIVQFCNNLALRFKNPKYNEKSF